MNNLRIMSQRTYLKIMFPRKTSSFVSFLFRQGIGFSVRRHITGVYCSNTTVLPLPCLTSVFNIHFFKVVSFCRPFDFCLLLQDVTVLVTVQCELQSVRVLAKIAAHRFRFREIRRSGHIDWFFRNFSQSVLRNLHQKSASTQRGRGGKCMYKIVVQEPLGKRSLGRPRMRLEERQDS